MADLPSVCIIGAGSSGIAAIKALKEKDIERLAYYQREKSGWVATPRHTIQVNCGEYTYDLRRELRKGAERAKKQGHPLIVPALAGAERSVVEAAE